MSESRWEHALHETKGLGNWRRDIPLLMGIVVLTFLVLRLIGSGDVGGSLVTALLIGFGVLVVLPLFELLSNYRRAPSVTDEIPRIEPAATEREEERDEPDRTEEDEERERYEALRERMLRARGGGTP